MTSLHSIRSDHTNWQLVYREAQATEARGRNQSLESVEGARISPRARCLVVLSRVVDLIFRAVVGAILWPICSVIGACRLLNASVSYLKVRWKEHKINSSIPLDVFPSGWVDRYSAERIASCDKKIEKLKMRALAIMVFDRSKLLSAGVTCLPTRGGVYPLTVSGQNAFRWEEFERVDFFTPLAGPDRDLGFKLRDLGEIAVRINRLNAQKAILQGAEKSEAEKNEAANTIAHMSLLKCRFIRELSKKRIMESMLYLLPGGVFLTKCLPTGRSRYQGKSELLPPRDFFSQDADLVAAHNRLVQNPYIVPYIVSRIV